MHTLHPQHCAVGAAMLAHATDSAMYMHAHDACMCSIGTSGGMHAYAYYSNMAKSSSGAECGNEFRFKKGGVDFKPVPGNFYTIRLVIKVNSNGTHSKSAPCQPCCILPALVRT
jgi:hypothetical protein